MKQIKGFVKEEDIDIHAVREMIQAIDEKMESLLFDLQDCGVLTPNVYEELSAYVSVMCEANYQLGRYDGIHETKEKGEANGQV